MPMLQASGLLSSEQFVAAGVKCGCKCAAFRLHSDKGGDAIVYQSHSGQFHAVFGCFDKM